MGCSVLYLRGTDEMNLSSAFRFFRSRSAIFATVSVVACMLNAAPVLAHHAMGGKTPSTFVEGFLSGIAHPLIGPDHFAFIAAVGLLAATRKQGILLPFVFILAAMLGTAMHVKQFGLPGVELFVSGSIVLFGLLVVAKHNLNANVLSALSAVAGLFHGYAYGEAIFGAETSPLLAYLAGFMTIQLVVSLVAFWVGRIVLSRSSSELKASAQLHSAGLVICGVGLAFFTSQMIGILLPTP
jgi:urease accessory protein